MKPKKLLILVTVIAVMLSLLLSSCGKDDTDNIVKPSATPIASPGNSSPSPNPGITVNYIEFNEIDIDMLDDTQKTMINDLAMPGGFYYWVDSEGVYTLFIGLGERPTAGYGIKVVSVEDNEGRTNVTVEETEPAKDDMVAQVLTYPYTLVQMDGITENFIIVDTNKNSFSLIEVENLERFTAVCVYQGLIDNTSIETTMDGTPVFFRNDDMAAKIDGLDEGTLVKITYSINREGQKILESIAQADLLSEIIVSSGIYQGLIDGNSLEVLVDGAYMALRNPDVESMAEGLERNAVVEVSYSISEEGQFLLVSIKPTE